MAVRLSRTFVLRKLHQLTGIIPLGAFLLEHFYTNSKAVTGPGDFNDAVARPSVHPLHTLRRDRPHLHPAALPRALRAFITWETRPNNLRYPYPRNWFYSIQRVTGMILFLFILFHLLNFRFGLIPGLNEVSVAHRPTELMTSSRRSFRCPVDSRRLLHRHPLDHLALRQRHLAVSG